MALTKKTNLQDMKIGDYIPCRYTVAVSGTVGYFSELGTCEAAEIPVTGVTVPNGLFNFIKVDNGLLIADRVIQTGISWNTLNSTNFIEHSSIYSQNIIPKMTSDTAPSGIAFASTMAATSNPFKAFNRIEYPTDGYWMPGTGDLPQWVGYEFPVAKKICKYTLGVINWTDVGRRPRNWEFQGSNDGIDWITLDSQSDMSFAAGERKSFIFNNSNSYTKYRVYITVNGGATTYGACIDEIEMMETVLPTNSSYRLLSGGCAYTNADGSISTTDLSLGAYPNINEWDKYIVNSDLKGTISKGDNNIWHWSSLYCWCKETPILALAASTNRVSRGATVNGLSVALSSATTKGFRPVLEYLETGSKGTTRFY